MPGQASAHALCDARACARARAHVHAPSTVVVLGTDDDCAPSAGAGFFLFSNPSERADGGRGGAESIWMSLQNGPSVYSYGILVMAY